MRRGSKGVQKKQYRKSILIVCEGQNTEPTYFRTLVKALRLDTTVEVHVIGKTKHTDPSGLLEDAIQLEKKRQEDHLASIVLRPYEEIWLVFDTEWRGKHPNLKQAVNEITGKGYKVAISSPSFETWFLLHDRPTPPGCARCDDAVAHLKKLHPDLKSYDKNAEATRRCVEWCLSEKRLALALKHACAQPDDCFSDTQPQLPIATATSVHHLVLLLVESCDDEPLKKEFGL